jgi:hypothetical protein
MGAQKFWLNIYSFQCVHPVEPPGLKRSRTKVFDELTAGNSHQGVVAAAML